MLEFKKNTPLCIWWFVFKAKESMTEQEQKLLRQIQELKEKQKSQESAGARGEIEKLECELSALQGKDITALEAENITLRKKATSLEKELQELRKRYSELRKIFGSLEPGVEKKPAAEKESTLARIIIKKYASVINEKETKTVGEIKALVNKDDLTVQAIVNDLKPEGYSFEKQYLETAEKTLQYITEEIEYVRADFGINFWLEPKEILEAGVSDDEDLAVLLCACLYALGDEKAQVVITELDNLTTHALVIAEIKGKFYILDPSQKTAFSKYSGEQAKCLEEFEFKSAKIKRFLYKFNASNYEQFV